MWADDGVATSELVIVACLTSQPTESQESIRIGYACKLWP